MLNAIKVGIYYKIPGDGREFVVTCASAVAIRSEDGRYVSGTFHIRVLPSYFIQSFDIISNLHIGHSLFLYCLFMNCRGKHFSIYR